MHRPLFLLVLVLVGLTHAQQPTPQTLTPGTNVTGYAVPNTYTYYTFTITDPTIRMFEVQMVRTAGMGDPDLFLKFNQLPNASSFDWADQTLPDQSGASLLSIDQTDVASPPWNGLLNGTWYLSVYGYGNYHGSNYSLWLNTYQCPYDCFSSASPSHGSCEPSTGVCTCRTDTDGHTYVGVDCRSVIIQATVGKVYADTVLPNSYIYYNLTMPVPPPPFVSVTMTQRGAAFRGDPDLYIGYGYAPTRTMYNHSDTTTHSVQELNLTDIPAGVNVIAGVFGYDSPGIGGASPADFDLTFGQVADVVLDNGQMVHNTSIAVGTWAYFKIFVGSSINMIDVVLTRLDQSDPDLYINHGVIPDLQIHDVADTAYGGGHANMNINVVQWHNMYWWMGVYCFSSPGSTVCSFDMTVNLYECGFNCSLNGQCQSGNCTCNSNATGRYCESNLVLNPPSQVVNTGSVRYHAWSYYNITVDPTQNTRVDVDMLASGGGPDLYMRGGQLTDVMVCSPCDVSVDPVHHVSSTYYGFSYVVIGVYGFSAANYSLNYTTSVGCPSNCSGHGTCTAQGTCVCDPNYSGPSCQIYTAVSQLATDGVFVDGSADHSATVFYNISSNDYDFDVLFQHSSYSDQTQFTLDCKFGGPPDGTGNTSITTGDYLFQLRMSQCNGYKQNPQPGFFMVSVTTASATVVNFKIAARTWVLSTSKQPNPDATVKRGGWVGFVYKVNNNASKLFVNMTVQTPQADPDVYVRAVMPPTRSAYNYADLSQNARTIFRYNDLVLTDPAGFEYVYIGIYGYDFMIPAQGVFSSTASFDACPGACSSPNGQCDTTTGVCNCTNGFTGPDCSAVISNVNYSSPQQFTVPSGSWAFYQLPILVAQYWHLELSVTPIHSSAPDTYIKFGSIPSATSYDVYDYNSGSITVETPRFDGHYYVGVSCPHYAAISPSCNFNLAVVPANCPQACSGHGTCDSMQHTCTCANGWTGPTCSASSQPLKPGVSFSGTVPPRSWVYFDIPGPSSGRDDVNSANYDVTFSVSFPTPSQFAQSAPPRLFLSADASLPTESNFLGRSSASLTGVQELKICKSQIPTTPRSVGLFNPHGWNPVDFTITSAKLPYCPGTCVSGGHGTCNTGDAGGCTCKDGYRGYDCSIAPESDENKGHPWWAMFLSIVIGLAVGFGIGWMGHRFRLSRNAPERRLSAGPRAAPLRPDKSESEPVVGGSSTSYARMNQ
eukprot:gnl/Spiro4/28727_TR14211_c0_g1_i1.p1 gnl/Spiro4/28727_TR14211_c0_g1~~gnl/Spiro4/28727_TR14211_c0_g1_i1.p1  ORF type:complete len:1220 (-),score=344.85 gnl/Spiro4/28727_TR14211_c0_g1_i1:17-3676(-)